MVEIGNKQNLKIMRVAQNQRMKRSIRMNGNEANKNVLRGSQGDNQQSTNQRKANDMATPKKPAKAKAQVKVKDLKPKKDAKGGLKPWNAQ